MTLGGVRGALRWRPEWPLTGIVAVTWALLLTGVVPQGSDASSGGAEGFGWFCDLRVGEGQAPQPADALPSLGNWTLMAVAMMSPVALPALRHVGLNSVRARRRRAMALALAGYLGVWVAFGALALGGVRLLENAFQPDRELLLVASLGVAAVWQLTRFKRRAIFACRRTVPLPPVGRPADAACVRFGLWHGWRGVQSCWALMLVLVAAGASTAIWMLALTAAIAAEELTLVGRRLVRPSAALLGVAALVVLGT